VRWTVLILIVLLTGAAFAQPVIEQPVPFDSSGRVFAIDRAMRNRFGLFPDAEFFSNARLWLSPAGYVLELGRTDSTRERRLLTEPEFLELKQQLALKLPSRLGLDQSGRGLFLLSQLPLALAWYSPAMLSLINPPDGTIGAAIYTTTAAAAFFAPLVITRNATVTQAQASMSVDYGYYGVFDGFALSSLIGWRNFFNQSEGPGWQYRATSAMMLATSVGGQVLGNYLGRRFTLGQARYASVLTDCGLADGLLTGIFLQSAGDNSLDGASRLNAALTIVGSLAGGYAGYKLGLARPWTEGQALVIGAGGFFGPLVADGAMVTVVTDQALIDHGMPLLSGFAVLGNVGGTYLAQRLVADRPISTSAGFMAIGATVGGGLLGAGLGLAIFGRMNQSQHIIAGFATAGTAGGFALGVKLARDLSGTAGFQSRQRIRLDFGQALAGAMSYSRGRAFSAPRLVTIEF
jgi:hypothetical protein